MLFALFVVLALVILAGIFYLAAKANQKDSAAGESPEATAQSEQFKADPVVQATESLVQLNLEIRKARLPDQVLQAYEGLIDDIITLLPCINEQSGGGQLAWAVNQMAIEYLPNKSVYPFIALNEDERLNAQNGVIETVAAMSGELAEIEGLVSSREVTAFNNKAEFLRQRFEA